MGTAEQCTPDLPETQTPEDEKPDRLSQNQRWGMGAILKQAEKLYRLIVDGKAWDTLASRCCNFSLDEALCAAYVLEKFSDCGCNLRSSFSVSGHENGAAAL